MPLRYSRTTLLCPYALLVPGWRCISKRRSTSNVRRPSSTCPPRHCKNSSTAIVKPSTSICPPSYHPCSTRFPQTRAPAPHSSPLHPLSQHRVHYCPRAHRHCSQGTADATLPLFDSALRNHPRHPYNLDQESGLCSLILGGLYSLIWGLVCALGLRGVVLFDLLFDLGRGVPG